MHREYAIAYCGRCHKCLDVLTTSTQLKVIFINQIDDFLVYKSFNPIDFLFKAAYKTLVQQKFSLTGKLFNKVFQCFSGFASPLYKTYASYLNNIFQHHILVLHFADVKKMAQLVAQYNIAVLVVNDWWLLSDEIIAMPYKGTVNIHPSDLPRYRGALPTLWSLKNNDHHTAVTFIRADSKMDQGDIIAQYPLTIEGEDILCLEKKVASCLREKMVPTIVAYLNDTLTLQKQDHAKASNTAKYEDYRAIAWETETAKDIGNKINLYPYLWPLDQCYTVYHGEKIYVKRARFEMAQGRGAFGSFYISTINVVVACQRGTVRFRLFIDLNFTDSVKLFFGTKREFA
jgi:methionyl-tRNA formyltransferase